MLDISLNRSTTQRSIFSCKGILVKNDSPSKLAKLESQHKSSSANENNFLIVYSFTVKGVNNGQKNLDSLYVDVPIADKIGRKSLSQAYEF